MGGKQIQSNLRSEQEAFHRKILSLSRERNLLSLRELLSSTRLQKYDNKVEGSNGKRHTYNLLGVWECAQSLRKLVIISSPE